MKSIAGMVRITGFVMSLLVCSIGVSIASGEIVSDTRSTAWDTDIIIPTVTEEVTIAVADEAPIQPSFGGNGKASLDTQTQADTQLTLIAEPAYMCGQGFAGRVISSNTNNTSVLIRLSDLNSRTVINLHPHVDSDGDYRQGVNYHNESSMFYVPAGDYQVLIIAYHGSTTDSVVFDSYIGTDCPLDGSVNGSGVIDSQQAWDHDLGQSTTNNADPENKSNNTISNSKPTVNNNKQFKISQSSTSSTTDSQNSTSIETSTINTNLVDSNTSTSDNPNNNSLDSGLTDHNKDKRKDDRYKWLIAVALGGGLILYGVKKK